MGGPRDMGGDKGFKRNPKKLTHDERLERSHVHQEHLKELVATRDAFKARLDEDADAVVDGLERFDQLPISERTRIGLSKGNYKHLTHVQAAALPHGLVGRDVLGSAKTGSGKTLAFLVPVLERLHVERWDGELGLGALILTPTRELALQIFKVLQVIGCKHPFAAALLTGGRNVDEEKKRLSFMSVVVATPGRILHHLTEASSLSVENLLMLVLDEADRLLDMGFHETISGILEHLPQGEMRQTLLFSATQSSDVQALAKLCLNNPVSAAAHAATLTPTPQNMNQNFLIVGIGRKLDALLAFIKLHPNDKVIVFVNTCNQVRFMYLALSKILKKFRVPTMCLTGKMKQFRRDEVFMTFCRCKSAVLFCTDIAARGLDFPLVHWVVQYDCPESVDTYIHRAGRTARAGARGVSVLFLTHEEKAMLYFLHQKKLPLREIAMRPNVLHDSSQLFVALVVQGLKFEAQKAFTSYVRSVQFASNKAVFDASKLDLEAFAKSLGLLVVPDMSALGERRSAKNVPWEVANYTAQVEAARAKEQAQAAKTSRVAARLAAREADDDDDVDADSAEDADEEDGGSVSDSDSDAPRAAAAPAAPKTRRERHLEASDMFKKGLEARLKFTAKERLEADTDGADILVKKAKPSTSAALAAAAASADPKAKAKAAAAAAAGAAPAAAASSKRQAFADSDDENDDLVEVSAAPKPRQPKPSADDELTYDERIAGISKQKQRTLIKTADLRIKDLHLSKHVVFGESDDDDEGDAAGAGAAAEASSDDEEIAAIRQTRTRPATVAEVAAAAAAVEDGSDSDDDDAALDAVGYAANLRSRLQATTKEDADRVRALKRERRDKKAGKDKDAVPDNFSDSGTSESDSGVSIDSVLAKQLRAARGESVSPESSVAAESDDDDDDDDGPALQESLAKRPQPGRRR